MEAITKNLKLVTLIIISASLVFSYPLSILFMSHNMTSHAMPHTPMNDESIMSALPFAESDACLTFHLDLLQKISESSPLLTNTFLALAALTIAFLFIALNPLNRFTANKRVHFQYQRLKRISLISFITQLGFWLTLTEKKAPAYAFAIA